MSRLVPQAHVTGFDCRECGNQIPVFAGSRGDAAPIDTSIFIMCPDCGHSGRYAAGEAYRFARYGAKRNEGLKGPHASLV